MWPEVLEFEKTLDMTQFSILLTHKKKTISRERAIKPKTTQLLSDGNRARIRSNSGLNTEVVLYFMTRSLLGEDS